MIDDPQEGGIVILPEHLHRFFLVVVANARPSVICTQRVQLVPQTLVLEQSTRRMDMALPGSLQLLLQLVQAR